MPKKNLKSNVICISEKRADDKFQPSTENDDLYDRLDRLHDGLNRTLEMVAAVQEKIRLQEIENRKSWLRHVAYIRKYCLTIV